MDQYSLQELPFKHNPTFKTYQSVLFQFQELLESHIKKITAEYLRNGIPITFWNKKKEFKALNAFIYFHRF